MANIKAEVLQSILADAETAKNVPGKKNVYDPVEYNKLATRSRAMGLVNDTEYLEAKIKPGSFEWDKERGCLKKIARNEPKLLDLNYYCANRYAVEKITVAAGKEKAGTYLAVVRGDAAVKEIENSSDLTATTVVYRFKKVKVETEVTEEMVEVAGNDEEGNSKLTVGEKFTYDDWEYIGTAVYAMTKVREQFTKKLNNEAMLELIQKIDANPNPRFKSGTEGDSLDDIA